MKSGSVRFWWIPLLIFSCMGLGFWIAFRFSGAGFRNEKENEEEVSFQWYEPGLWNMVKEYIEEYYVDTISSSRLEDEALTALLHRLDPHSEYIPPAHFKRLNEPLEGNFEGIGVEFNIIHDTVRVMHVIPGGPSEKAGIFGGDRIIRADTIDLTGNGLSNEKVFRALRGPKDSKVTVRVVRSGFEHPLEIQITRGKIPIHSLDASFMIRPGVGYMKFRQFSATTSEEFRKAVNQLFSAGMKKIILDLRGNGGGFLNAAVEMADEFLYNGMMIVYTQGRKYPRKEFFSTEYGALENIPLVVLVDEESASASEIVAGAIQDNDRGVLVGRRTFGKGLVQDQIPLSNGGAIRLTVARYYTPSGRCIQKPYSDNLQNYLLEEVHRFEAGEFFHVDSIHPDTSKKFRTPAGRVVYGGGGIIPDIFVPLDTARFHTIVYRWYRSGNLNRFSYDWADKNREKIKRSFPTEELFLKKFLTPESLLGEWHESLSSSERKYCLNPRVLSDLKFIFKALVGRIIYGDAVFFPLWSEKDKDIQKALEVISNDRWMADIIKKRSPV